MQILNILECPFETTPYDMYRYMYADDNYVGREKLKGREIRGATINSLSAEYKSCCFFDSECTVCVCVYIETTMRGHIAPIYIQVL